MNTKILYVLTSDETDIYYEQLLVSVTSLRLYMSKEDAWVTVLTDNKTNETLKGFRAQLEEVINEKIVINFEDDVNKFSRSRLLKTAMRKYVKGNFLYVDSDTVICDRLDELDDFDFELGAVMNAHINFMDNPYRNWHVWQAKHLGWDVSTDDVYYNGGLCFSKEGAKSDEFFKQWNEGWIYSNNKGIPNDEPSFAQANIVMNYPLKEMPGEWNCQLKYGLKYLNKVKILHFLCTQYMPSSKDCLYYFMDKAVYLKIRENNGIPDDVMYMLRHPLEGFNKLTMIVGGSDVEMLHDHTAVERLMLSSKTSPKLYKFCNQLIINIYKAYNFLNRIKK